MAYRYGNRYQMELLPKSIEEYVETDDPVRVYDAFVETLNFNELKLTLDPNKVGCPEYYPKAILKLLTYGYSYGFRSSRKLERAIYHNVSFMWLMGGLKPDHKTIAEFRRKNKASIKNVLKACARLCIRLNLIAGNTLFVDGTKVRANASIKNTWTKKKCERALGKIDTRIEAILSECDAVDEYEQKIKVVVPSQRQASRKEPKPFDKSNFQYDSEKDCYICPEGHFLTYRRTNKREQNKVYMIREKAMCKQCPHWGVCTKSQQGRQITRLINEEVRQKLEAQYEEAESQAIYKLRQQKAELPFGHIKRNLKVDAFLLRGLDGVKAEASLLASCFNIRRMISIIGIRALIEKLKNLASLRGTFSLNRWDFALPLPSAGLESFVYPKEEIRASKENSVFAFIENSNKTKRIWINRLFVSRRSVGLPFLCQRAFL